MGRTIPTVRRCLAIMALPLMIAGCAAAQETAQGWRDRIATIDIDAALEDLRDCDRLSQAFVEVVQTAAEAVDGLAERTEGRVPVTDIRTAVDNIAVSEYFEIAERIGCARLQQRLDTVDQLRDLTPDTPAGQDFLEEILRQVETAR